MYGLPSNVDLSFLVGATLNQACFGANELILKFSGDTTLTIESSYRVAVPGHDSTLFDDVRTSAPSVVGLIERRVSGVEGSTDGTLSILFDAAYRLDVYDTSAQFESYQIVHGDQMIVV